MVFHDPLTVVQSTEWSLNDMSRDRWADQRLFNEVKRLIRSLELAGCTPTCIRLEVRGLTASSGVRPTSPERTAT